MKYILWFVCCFLSPAILASTGDFGVEVDVTTIGLFPPKLESVTVATVKEGSSADRAGVQVGDKIVSINGCNIPGCSAFKAKRMMNVEQGETAQFQLLSAADELRTIDLLAE